MNRRQTLPQTGTKNSAYRQALERLDAALEHNTESDNTHKIRLLRLAMFADVHELETSGKVVIPK